MRLSPKWGTSSKKGVTKETKLENFERTGVVRTEIRTKLGLLVEGSTEILRVELKSDPTSMQDIKTFNIHPSHRRSTGLEGLPLE